MCEHFYFSLYCGMWHLVIWRRGVYWRSWGHWHSPSSTILHSDRCISDKILGITCQKTVIFLLIVLRPLSSHITVLCRHIYAETSALTHRKEWTAVRILHYRSTRCDLNIEFISSWTRLMKFCFNTTGWNSFTGYIWRAEVSISMCIWMSWTAIRNLHYCQ